MPKKPAVPSYLLYQGVWPSLRQVQRQESLVQALRLLRGLYGRINAPAFGPLALQAWKIAKMRDEKASN